MPVCKPGFRHFLNSLCEILYVRKVYFSSDFAQVYVRVFVFMYFTPNVSLFEASH